MSIQFPFYSPEFCRLMPERETDYSDVISLLSDERLIEETEKGNVTLAMIRPNIGPDGNILGLSDQECAELIEEMIQGLGVMAKFSFTFDAQSADTFYSGTPQKTMEKATPKDPDSYESRWPEFVDFMASGPTTALLLYSEDGDAIEKWRAHLGHWNIDKNRDPTTIRGALGVNLFNNLVHGSDAPESVLKEIAIISDILTEK